MMELIGQSMAAVLEGVRAGRDASEAERTLSKDVVASLVQADLFRLAVPPSITGRTVEPLEILDILEALADADVSAAWLVWNNMLPALFAKRLARSARADLFGSPRAVYGNSTRATGRLEAADGCYVLSGRWSLVSGCRAATHFALLGDVVVDGEAREVAPGVAERRLAFITASDVDVLDTWYSGGLRGSGSHDVTVDQVEVPAEHTCPLVGPAPAEEGRLDRFPIMSLMTLAGAAMLVSLAATCRDAVISIASTAASTDSRPSLALRPVVAQGLARAAANIEASRSALGQAVGSIDAVLDGGDVDPLLRARAMEAVDLARRLSLDAIRSLYELGGTSSVYTDRPLERAHRDAHVMVQHIMYDPMWLEQAGRVRLGLPPTIPLF